MLESKKKDCNNMDYFNLVKAYLSAIKPSQYGYILPLYDRFELDELALQGHFPALNGLAGALVVVTILGISRLFLTHTIMKVIKCIKFNSSFPL